MQIKKVEFVRSAGRPEDFPPSVFSEIAMVGRSNVGKSSLLNSLLGQKGLARVSTTPGKTQLINFFKVVVAGPKTRPFHIVDLPGYGYARASKALRSRWANLVERYLAGREGLMGTVVLLDIRHEPSCLDRQLRGWLEPIGVPIIWVAAKADLLPRGRWPGAFRRIKQSLGLPETEAVLPVSARTGEGRKELLALIQAILVS